MKKRILSLALSLGLFTIAILGASATQTENKEKEENYSSQIIFNNLKNSEKEYEKLKEANTLFASENFKKTKLNNENDAGEFVDEKEFTTKEEINFVENESIYFDNSVFSQFINENGETKNVASKFNLPNEYAIASENTEIITSENIEEIFKQSKDVLYFDIEDSENFSENDLEYEPLIVDEDLYLKNIKNIILNITKTPYDSLSDSLKENINNYFADNCYSLLNSRQLSEDVLVTADYILSGKSDINLEYKDRILMQITATENDKTVSNCILFKLDENGKIYNINILDL